MRRRIFVAVLLFVFAPALGSSLSAQVRNVPGGVLLTFQDADLAFVLNALAQAAGINFSYSDLPQKPITLRTTEPMSRDQILAFLRNLAEANGVSVIQSDGMLRLQGTPTIQGLPEDPRQLYIHKLKHARAPILASTLQVLFGGGGTVGRAGGNAQQTLTQQLRTFQGQGGNQQPIIINQGTVGGNAFSPFGPVVVPDEVTNSLLVRASPSDWQVMQQAIQGLDLRPLQVVIEVVIAEVRRTDNSNIGVSIVGDASRNGQTTVGTLPSTATESDFSLHFIRAGDIDIDATISALASTGNVRILSRPVVQAQNNQEARITVGSERPFIQVSRSATQGSVAEDVVQYRDVATTLTILPTINDDGYVNMAVTQTINTATNETQFGAPVISKREAETQILARSGQTVVIGGLMDRQTDRTRSGIPFLKDLPLIGALFGTTRDNGLNSELFLFLTPHLVATDADADRVKRELENRVDLLKQLTPIEPLIPAVPRPIRPDTVPTRVIRPDTIPAGRNR
jgi:type II secretory pathway component GspD/PulD (secretin)